MNNLTPWFSKYRKILVFDTETTGLRCKADEIIQFSAVLLELENGSPVITNTYNRLIRLAPGQTVPPEITNLTGITDEALQTRGISREEACREIAALLEGSTLLVAYNAQFDLTFLYFMLYRFGHADALKGKDKLDLLTVYRDRRPYPHKLFCAIEAYGLENTVQNSHSADDDALAAAWVMDSMEGEHPDLLNYVNLFGYIPKYGPPKPAVGSITYRPQPYNPPGPLYGTESGTW